MDDELEARQVVGRPHLGGELQHAHEHRGHELAVGDVVALDLGQALLGVEALHDDDRRADALDREAAHERGGVVERRGGQVRRRRAGRVRRAVARERALVVRHEPAGLGERPLDGLRPPRGPRGVEELAALGRVLDRPVVERLDLAPRVGRLVELAVAAEHDVDARDAAREPGDERALGDRGDEDPRAAVAQDVLDLVGAQVPVDRGVVEPGPLRGPRRLEEPLLVLHEDRDHLAAPQPERREEPRELAGATRQLAVGEDRAARAHHHGGVRGTLGRDPTEEVPSELHAPSHPSARSLVPTHDVDKFPIMSNHRGRTTPR